MSSKKKAINIILFFILFSLTLQEEKTHSFKDLIDRYLSKLEINNAYLSYNQYISLLNTLKEDYPNYFHLSSIGKTYENNDIPLIIMKSPLTNDDNNGTKAKSGILFNAMHHGREPVSMMMNIYLILHLLTIPKMYLHLFLSNTNIYFIPIINIDTYKYNCEQYAAGKGTNGMMARKNRRIIKNVKCKSDEDIGIDLNRNYDYLFGKDNDGSSNSPCQEDYRGEFPFSEPETKAIKDFVDSHPDIKIVHNYHTWGNLIITAFNCFSSKESENLMKSKYPIHYKMYLDFKNEAQYPQNFLFGNAASTIKYKTNGDATDWFLGKKNILSFSPELGNGNKNSDNFYPNREITFDVLDKNLYGGIYAIQKSMFYLKGELISAIYYQCTNNNKLYQNYNLKQFATRKCLFDEMIFEIKSKIINAGFADYTPGLEFPINLSKNETNNFTKKYYYFLDLDLSIDIDKVKSVCYWSTLETIYMNEIGAKENKPDEKVEFIGNVRCIDINNKEEINNIRLFIDIEIKSMKYIVLNIILLVKKEAAYEIIFNNNTTSRYNKRFLQFDKSKNIKEKEIIKIYRKENRKIKSEKINGDIMEWKFNSPVIEIKYSDLKNQNKSVFAYKNFYVNSRKVLFVIFVSVIIIMILMFFAIKQITRRNMNRLLMNNSLENNNDINFGMNNEQAEQAVNNLENINENNINNNLVNNENIPPMQIPREDNEVRPGSNEGSPNQLNA